MINRCQVGFIRKSPRGPATPILVHLAEINIYESKKYLVNANEFKLEQKISRLWWPPLQTEYPI